MRYLTFALACLVTVAAQADCVDRVADTQARIVELTGGNLDERQRTQLTALLLELCAERERGSSVIHDADRTVISTQGMNEKQPVANDNDTRVNDTPVFVGVEIERDGRRRPRPNDSDRDE